MWSDLGRSALRGDGRAADTIGMRRTDDLLTGDPLGGGRSGRPPRVGRRHDPYGRVPAGRAGLFHALAVSVAPAPAERALPVTDTARLGVPPSMFDYDPELATELMAD